MVVFKRLVSRRALFVLAFAALTGTGAAAGTIHRLNVSQTSGGGSLGSTAFLNTQSSGGAVQAQVGPSNLTSLSYPFGLFGLYNSGQIGFGVVGLSTTAYGVAGESTAAYASVFGLSAGTGSAVEGMNPDTSSTAAPAGDFVGTGGIGIQVTTSGAQSVALNAAGTASGGGGIVANGGTTSGECVGYAGVGIGICAEGQNVGASFIGDGVMGVGVGGTDPICNNSGNSATCAPLGLATPSSNGSLPAEDGAGVGGVGVSGPGVYGYSYYDYGIYAQNSGTAATLEVENAKGTGSNPAIQVNDDATGKTTVVTAAGNIYTSGSVTTNDTVNAVSRNPATDVMTYSTQQAEATVEDVGTARLVNGSAAVPLAADFRQTMNESAPYMVIVTPYGESRGLYVASRTPAGFIVRENGGGRSTLQFDYRVVAQPYGTPHARLPHLHDVITFPRQPARNLTAAGTRLLAGTVALFGSRPGSAAATAARKALTYKAPAVPKNMFNLSGMRNR